MAELLLRDKKKIFFATAGNSREECHFLSEMQFIWGSVFVLVGGEKIVLRAVGCRSCYQNKRKHYCVRSCRGEGAEGGAHENSEGPSERQNACRC